MMIAVFFLQSFSSQRDNDGKIIRDSPHIRLNLPSHPPCVSTESVPLTPQHTPSLDQVADTTLCDTFAVSVLYLVYINHASIIQHCIIPQRCGYCHRGDCLHSHDVMTVLIQHEYQQLIKQIRRKRKRGDLIHNHANLSL